MLVIFLGLQETCMFTHFSISLSCFCLWTLPGYETSIPQRLAQRSLMCFSPLLFFFLPLHPGLHLRSLLLHCFLNPFLFPSVCFIGCYPCQFLLTVNFILNWLLNKYLMSLSHVPLMAVTWAVRPARARSVLWASLLLSESTAGRVAAPGNIHLYTFLFPKKFLLSFALAAVKFLGNIWFWSL